MTDLPTFGDSTDFIDHSEFGERLTEVCNASELIQTILVSGKWGVGKTDFIRRWRSHVQESHNVIYYDAFEADILEDPFKSLSQVIYQFVKENSPDKKEDILNSLSKVGKQFVRPGMKLAAAVAVKQLIGENNNTLDEVQDDISNAFGEITEITLRRDIKEFAEKQSGFAELRNLLKGCGRNDDENKTPLVFIVDEIDRCRPDFAISVLEIIKHIFSAQGVKFVIFVDRIELQALINGRFGENFDSETYLERFFDASMEFPTKGSSQERNEKKFITSWKAHLQEIEQCNQLDRCSWVIKILIDAHPVSLRALKKTLNHLHVLLANKESSQQFTDILTVLVWAKYCDQALFQKCVEGQVELNDFMRLFNAALLKKRDLTDELIQRFGEIFSYEGTGFAGYDRGQQAGESGVDYFQRVSVQIIGSLQIN